MRASLLAAAALLAFAVTGPAHATPAQYTLSFLSGGEVASLAHGSENLTIHDTAATLSEGAAVGPVTLDVHAITPGGKTTPLELLCTDIFDYYVPGRTYTLGLLSDTVHDGVKQGQIAALLEHGLSGATDAATSAALQAAVWEVENEPGDSGYDVTSGNFYVSGYGGGLDKTMVTDANADLSKVETGIWKPEAGEIVKQFEPAFSALPDQSFAFIAPAPEPAGTTLLGFGALLAIGAARRRTAVLCRHGNP